MANPRATTYTDLQLTSAFRNYDTTQQPVLFLLDVPVGGRFEIDGRGFEKLKNNRTRAVCKDLKNGKKYLVPKMAEVRWLDK